MDDDNKVFDIYFLYKMNLRRWWYGSLFVLMWLFLFN